jgi:hypothetical protein
MSRRRDFAGAAEALAESFEEAFCGRTRSASAASFRAFWRRRWGRSTVDAGRVTGDSELREVFAASTPVIEPSPVPVAVNAPLLEFARALSSSALAEKYSSRNRDVVPVIVLLTFDVPEKFLLAFRTADFALARKHDAHMVDDAFDRKALIGGNRIIMLGVGIPRHGRIFELDMAERLSRWCGLHSMLRCKASQSSTVNLYRAFWPRTLYLSLSTRRQSVCSLNCMFRLSYYPFILICHWTSRYIPFLTLEYDAR